jgi:DUF4097 and DUF4098 domain-containing protein YvlB
LTKIKEQFVYMKIRQLVTVATVLAAASAATLSAQNKVTVPLSSPSQPATIKAQLFSGAGSITVTGGSGSQVVVESSGEDGRDRGRRARDRDGGIPPGMRRLDTSGGDLDIVEDHNVVTIRVGASGRNENLVIQAPVNTSVELKTISGGGHIDVTGISGSIDVECTNGSVTLTKVSGSVQAHTTNGELTASIDRITPGKPMSFTSLNGRVDVTLPGDTKARLRLKTTNGAIYSDFDVKMEPDAAKPVVEDARGQGGKYRIRVDRSVYGSINGGGPEFLFQTMNGDILIHKK